MKTGDWVYVIYDKYYAKGNNEHEWVLYSKDEQVKIVRSIIIESVHEPLQITYEFDRVIFRANDTRQYCSSSCEACIPFSNLQDALDYIEVHNKYGKKKRKKN